MNDGTDNRRGGMPAYAMQRERLGEWAAVLCVALFALLAFFCWPAARARGPSSPSALPEPSASYVEVVFPHGFQGVLPRHSARRIDASGGTFSLLPKPALPPLPPVPRDVPAAPPPPPVPSWTAPAMDVSRFPIEPGPPAFPGFGGSPSTSAVLVVMSPSLRRAGFAFPVPAAAAPVRFSCLADLSPDGRVRTLLMNGGKTPAEALLPWRLAILAGRAETNGCGKIDVERRETARLRPTAAAGTRR